MRVVLLGADHIRSRPLKISKKIQNQNASGKSDQTETATNATRLIRNVNHIDTPEPMTPETDPSEAKAAFVRDMASKAKRTVADNELMPTSPIDTQRRAFSLIVVRPFFISGLSAIGSGGPS